MKSTRREIPALSDLSLKQITLPAIKKDTTMQE